MRFTPLPREPERWIRSVSSGALLGGILFLGAQVMIHAYTSGWLRQNLEETLMTPAIFLSWFLYCITVVSAGRQPQRRVWGLAILATAVIGWTVAVEWTRGGIYD